MPSLRRSSLLVLGAGVLATAAGCLPSDTTSPTVTPATSYVRIVQGVSDTQNGIDVGINRSLVLVGDTLGLVVPTPGYSPIPAVPQLTFALSGSSTAFYNNAAVEALAANANFTIVVFGRTSSGATPAATVSILADTTASAPSAALIRVFNTVDYVTPGSGTPVDVYVYSATATRPTTPSIAGLMYGARSSYVSVTPGTPGTVQVDVFAAGAASTGTPLFKTTLTAGSTSVRTLVLIDPPGASTGNAHVGSVVTLVDSGLN